MIRITVTKRPPGQVLLTTALLAVAALLWGCTEGMVEDIGAEASQPITLRFSNPNLGEPAAPTRAETAPPEPLTAGATVRIAAYYLRKDQAAAAFETSPPTYEATYEVQGDGSLTPCKVDNNGKKIDGAATGLSVRGGTYDFYAVSPARSLQQGSNNKYQITGIPHKEDVMTSFQRNVAVSATSNVVALNTFTRQCALVVFNVASSPDNVLLFDRLYGTSLILRKASTSGASLIAGEDTGIPPTGGSPGTASEVTFSGDDFELVENPTAPGQNKAKGTILPKNNTAFDVSLTVVRDDETATLSATIDKHIAFDPGKKYIFTLEVKNNESRLQLTVLDWSPIPFTDTGVGSPDGTRPDPDIDTGTGTTITVAQWDDMPWTGNGLAGNNGTVKIDDSVLQKYIAHMASLSLQVKPTLTTHPPFDINGDGGKWIKKRHPGIDFTLTGTPTMTGNYKFQVSTKNPNKDTYANMQNYCKNLREGTFTDWRLPTQIELYAIWDKARGTNNDASDNEPDSYIYGEQFVGNFYMSYTAYNNNPRSPSGMSFNEGKFNDRDIEPAEKFYARCVRDKTINISPPITRAVYDKQ